MVIARERSSVGDRRQARITTIQTSSRRFFEAILHQALCFPLESERVKGL